MTHPDPSPCGRWPLDEPLPQELIGSGYGWLGGYRRWSALSPRWGRSRALRLGLTLWLALIVPTAFSLLGGADDLRGLGPLLQLAFNLGMPLALGPWLAGRVRQRGWSEPRETRAVIAALAAVVLLQLGLSAALAEPFKQAVAEAVGAVDEQGQRKRITLTLGLQVAAGQEPAGVAAGPETPPLFDRAMSIFSGALLTWWLAGGLGLSALRRERSALAALAQQRALAAAESERREAELRLSVLAAQVEPHFLFNTLAGVRSAVATDPARATTMIDALVAYLRASIPRLRRDDPGAHTLGEQAEIVRAYLELMGARMPRLRHVIDIPADLRELPFPPLMLITLAENAVKHGVEPRPGPAQVALRAERRDDGALAVSVEDDGVGFSAAGAGTGLGLSNLRQRLAQLYAGRARLELQARPEGGVAATLVLPPSALPEEPGP